jgi:hypothetical protein
MFVREKVLAVEDLKDSYLADVWRSPIQTYHEKYGGQKSARACEGVNL